MSFGGVYELGMLVMFILGVWALGAAGRGRVAGAGRRWAESIDCGCDDAAAAGVEGGVYWAFCTWPPRMTPLQRCVPFPVGFGVPEASRTCWAIHEPNLKALIVRLFVVGGLF